MAILNLPFAPVALEVPAGWATEVGDSMVVIVHEASSGFRASVVALPASTDLDLRQSLTMIPEPLVLVWSTEGGVDRCVYAYATPAGAVTVDQRLYRSGSVAASLTGTVATARLSVDWPGLQDLLASCRSAI